MPTSPLTRDDRDQWNTFAGQARDSWFWHLTQWLDFVREAGGGNFVADHSFSITVEGELVATCPVVVEERGYGRQLSMLGGPIPFPAIKDGVSSARRQQVLTEYVSTLQALADKQKVSYARIKWPFLRSLQSASLAEPNPLLRFGFFDLSCMTQLVDLRPDDAVLWSGVRKGHLSDIKRAMTRCTATVWDQRSITTAKFREYQALHAKDAGRVTRSQASFDMMEDWVRRGIAVLAEVSNQGQAIAFALVMAYKNGAYYGSGCQDPDHVRLGASHLLQWEIISWLKRAGFLGYDVGMQQFGPQWFEVPTEKDVSIAAFKRGFGGELVEESNYVSNLVICWNRIVRRRNVTT